MMGNTAWWTIKRVTPRTNKTGAAIQGMPNIQIAAPGGKEAETGIRVDVVIGVETARITDSEMMIETNIEMIEIMRTAIIVEGAENM
jgi:hypothetical protein